MSERDVALDGMLEKARVADGITPATAMIAENDPRALNGAAAEAILIGIRTVPEALEAREHYDQMLQIHEEMEQQREEIKGKVGGEAQNLVRLLHEHDIVAPAQLLDAILVLQDEESHLTDLDLPEDADEHNQAELEASLEVLAQSRARLEVLVDEARLEVEHTSAPQKRAEFAREIGRTQQRLSRPMRFAATILTAVTLSAGLGTSMYELADHDQAANGSNQTKQEKVVAESPKTVAEVGALLGGVSGGILGLFGGLHFADREARRRAKKLVAQASK